MTDKQTLSEERTYDIACKYTQKYLDRKRGGFPLLVDELIHDAIRAALAERTAQAGGEDARDVATCLWTKNEDGYFDTSCGQAFVFTDGGPSENRMEFCCYCGGRLTEDMRIDTALTTPGAETMSDELTREQIEELRERSKDDKAIIVGSEIRQLCAMALRSLSPPSGEPVAWGEVPTHDSAGNKLPTPQEWFKAESSAPPASEAVTWMRIIYASNGQPILFYIENDTAHDDCSMIHCYARFDGFDADMKLKGIPTSKVADMLAALSTRSADAIVKDVAKLMEGDDE
ncbi:MAG: hypothetical protein ACM3SS_06885 [Rhodospirillaceae bacterium]